MRCARCGSSSAMDSKAAEPHLRSIDRTASLAHAFHQLGRAKRPQHCTKPSAVVKHHLHDASYVAPWLTAAVQVAAHRGSPTSRRNSHTRTHTPTLSALAGLRHPPPAAPEASLQTGTTPARHALQVLIKVLCRRMSCSLAKYTRHVPKDGHSFHHDPIARDAFRKKSTRVPRRRPPRRRRRQRWHCRPGCRRSGTGRSWAAVAPAQ